MRGVSLLLVIGALGLGACGEDEAGCAALGEMLAIGDAVEDAEAGLRCVCRADGPICLPLSQTIDAGPQLADFGAADAAPAPDAGLIRDAEVELDGAPLEDAEAPAEDAGVGADLGSPADPCPAGRPFGRCEGQEGLICDYGVAPFMCCAREYRAELICNCTEDALWHCVDQRANCLASDVGRACLREAEVCAAWGRIVGDRGADQNYAWGGDVAACDPGDMDPEWRQRALDRVNDWRTLGDLPPVRLAPDRNALAQACALALRAGGRVTHSLEPDAPCYSPEAQRGAAESNVMVGRGPIGALWAYISDWGGINFAGLPHRLWVLSGHLGPIGLGATDSSTCMHVARGTGDAGRSVIPWPAPGPFPYDAHLTAGVGLGEDTGWSIHSDRVNMNNAEVTVLRVQDALEMPIEQRRLEAAGGAGHGLAFIPQGWGPQPGETYRVTVEGLRDPLSYEVDFIDCEVQPAP